MSICPGRKRRTVLWLFKEDFEFLELIAKTDGETKNASMHRLVRALRASQISSFRNVESSLNSSTNRSKPSESRLIKP